VAEQQRNLWVLWMQPTLKHASHVSTGQAASLGHHRLSEGVVHHHRGVLLGQVMAPWIFHWNWLSMASLKEGRRSWVTTES
jgi:hypothetical protein